MHKIPCNAEQYGFFLAAAPVASCAFDLKIAEAVVAEALMPVLNTRTLQRVAEPFRAAGTSLGDEAGGIEQFAGNDFDARPSRAPNCNLRPAGHVLSQVIDIDTGFRLSDSYGLINLHHANRRNLLRHQSAAGRGHDYGLWKRGFVQSGFIPVRRFDPRIKIFAAINGIESNGGGKNAPGSVAHDALRRSISVYDLQLKIIFGGPNEPTNFVYLPVFWTLYIPLPSMTA